MDEFRFHMTLTGRLDETRRRGMLQMLRERFSEVGISSLAVNRIALLRQDDADSRFRIIGSWPLTAMSP
jgi:2'-5' RNA ligase